MNGLSPSATLDSTSPARNDWTSLRCLIIFIFFMILLLMMPIGNDGYQLPKVIFRSQPYAFACFLLIIVFGLAASVCALSSDKPKLARSFRWATIVLVSAAFAVLCFASARDFLSLPTQFKGCTPTPSTTLLDWTSDWMSLRCLIMFMAFTHVLYSMSYEQDGYQYQRYAIGYFVLMIVLCGIQISVGVSYWVNPKIATVISCFRCHFIILLSSAFDVLCFASAFFFASQLKGTKSNTLGS